MFWRWTVRRWDKKVTKFLGEEFPDGLDVYLGVENGKKFTDCRNHDDYTELLAAKLICLKQLEIDVSF